MLRGSLLSAAVLLSACATKPPPGPNRGAWVVRGDSTIDSDPGRSLANYLRAPDAAGEAKVRDARLRWIRTELEKRRQSPTTTDPGTDLAFALAARAEAKTNNLESDLATDLETTEATFAAAWWKHELAALPTRAKTPLEQYGHVLGLRKLVPTSAPDVARLVDDEAKTRLTNLFANLAELRAKAFSEPAAQVLHETLTTALQQGKPDRAKQAAIAKTAQLTVATTTDLCEELSSLAGAVPPGEGAHRVTLRVQGTCSANESSRSYTERETWTTTKTEEYTDTEYEEQCSNKSSYEAPTCVRRYAGGPNDGQCASYRDNSKTWQECTKVPKQVRRTREVEEQHSGTYNVDERTLSARVEGTYVITVDGVEKRVPFGFSKDEKERKFRSRSDSGSFTNRTPRSVLRPIADDIARDLRKRVDDIARELYSAHLATARAKLAAGDMPAAEANVAIAIFAGATTLDSDFEPLAARAGMPLKDYADALRTGSLTAERAVTLPVAMLSMPGADTDLADEEARAERVLADYNREKSIREGAAAELDQPLSSIGIGLDQWSGLDNTTHGLTFLYARQKGGGRLGGFWYRDFGLAADINVGRLAVNLEAPVRIGAGLRHPKISIAGYLVAGASRRGADDALDPGLPLSVDAGYGVQLVLGGTGERRLELSAERLLRPLVDVPEAGMTMGGIDFVVQQRLRYELRYIKEDFIGDSWGGGRLWCTFEQATNGDALFASSPTHMRTCAAVVHVMFD